MIHLVKPRSPPITNDAQSLLRPAERECEPANLYRRAGYRTASLRPADGHPPQPTRYISCRFRHRPKTVRNHIVTTHSATGTTPTPGAAPGPQEQIP